MTHSIAILAGGIAITCSSIALVTALLKRDTPSPSAAFALASVVWLGVSYIASAVSP